jgi:hypothetical protein
LPGRVAEAATVLALAVVVTVAIAAPVIRAPSERVFGMEIAGRHHDPFTVMEQFERPVHMGVYAQPVTDLAGALFARMSGGVAAYNWLVLLSFPLSAGGAYLLARHLALSWSAASVAAMAFAFSPFHLAHAAYHPHVAQTQWLPLYLLALWRCLDKASPAAIGLLGAATAAVTLSNFYAGFIAAIITPVAVAAYWFAACRRDPGSIRRLVMTVGSLALLAACGIAYASYTAGAVLTDRAAFAFPRADLFRYSAKWWSYLVPPVGHPLMGATVLSFWTAAGIREGLLEQQVSLGWGIVVLGLIAVVGWLLGDSHLASRRRIPILVVVAVTALVCSLSPERTIGSFTFVRPSALFYTIVPMFRSYARFGVVVQLMAALLAGIGMDYLRWAGTKRARIVCVVLLAVAVGEYAVAPSAEWRDVLPSAAHRWIMRQPGPLRAFDCAPLTQESASVQWLTDSRVTLLDSSASDCLEPNLPQKLAAGGYTHLLVRRDTSEGQWFAAHTLLDGLVLAARFDDGSVFTVTGQAPAIYTAALRGFFPREHIPEWSWRWMGADAAWTVVNTTGQPIVAALELELSAFHRTRLVELVLDGRHAQTLAVDPPRRVYDLGPFAIGPGSHELVFHPADPPDSAHDVIETDDRRPLSLAIGTWSWSIRGEQP